VQSAVNAIRRFLGYMDIMVVSDDQDFIPLGSEVRSILSDVEAIAHSRKTRSENNVADCFPIARQKRRIFPSLQADST
jgi:hypothetical protein